MASSKELGSIDPVDNVIELFGRPPPGRRLAATDEEIAEYRRMWPLVMQMLREWEQVKNQKTGCPVLTNILAPD